MERRRGFTITELVVSLVVSSILILIIGVLSNIAIGSHDQVKKENDVQRDLFYGISRMMFLGRKAGSLSVSNAWPNPPWVSIMLIVDNGAFGLYRPSGQSKTDFVFVPDKLVPSVRQPLLVNASGMSFTASLSGDCAIVGIQGNKDNEDFAVSNISVMRRN